MGQGAHPVISNDNPLFSFSAPDPRKSERFVLFDTYKEHYGLDRYFIASFGISGFTIMTLLLGFLKTSIYLASSGEVKGITGKYFAKKKMKAASKKCSDIKLQKELWQLSERLTGINRYCVKSQLTNSPLDTVFYCKYFTESRQQHILSCLDTWHERLKVSFS